MSGMLRRRERYVTTCCTTITCRRRGSGVGYRLVYWDTTPLEGGTGIYENQLQHKILFPPLSDIIFPYAPLFDDVVDFLMCSLMFRHDSWLSHPYSGTFYVYMYIYLSGRDSGSSLDLVLQ